jgi:hypothetical protein
MESSLVIVESPLRGRVSAWVSHLTHRVANALLLPASVQRFVHDVLERRGRRRNRAYALACMRDCLERGEAPYASHLLFDHPGLLDDANPQHRKLGMEAGFCWGRVGACRVFYLDLGMSSGMRDGLSEAVRLKQQIRVRTLGGSWFDPELYLAAKGELQGMHPRIAHLLAPAARVSLASRPSATILPPDPAN